MAQQEVSGLLFERGGWKSKTKYQSLWAVLPASSPLVTAHQAALKAEEAGRTSIAAPIRNASCRILNSSASRIVLEVGSPSAFNCCKHVPHLSPVRLIAYRNLNCL